MLYNLFTTKNFGPCGTRVDFLLTSKKKETYDFLSVNTSKSMVYTSNSYDSYLKTHHLL